MALSDKDRTQLQETGRLIIEPRVTVAEITDLLSDLGLTLGYDAKLVEGQTMFGVGLCLTTEEATNV